MSERISNADIAEYLDNAEYGKEGLRPIIPIIAALFDLRDSRAENARAHEPA